HEHLILSKKARLDIIENDRVKFEEVFGGCWKDLFRTVVAHLSKANQDRLVVLFCGLLVFVEAGHKPIGGIDRFVTKYELHLFVGNAHQSRKLDLHVLFQRATNEFELPVRAAANVQNAEW